LLLIPLGFYKEDEGWGSFSREQSARTSVEKTTMNLDSNQRNCLKLEELRMRQEKSSGREDYPGEMRIPRQVAESYVAAIGPRDLRRRYRPINKRRKNSLPISLCIPWGPPKSFALWHELCAGSTTKRDPPCKVRYRILENRMEGANGGTWRRSHRWDKRRNYIKSPIPDNVISSE